MQKCQQYVSIASMHYLPRALQGSLARPARRVAHPAQSLMQNVNNASALQACITYPAPLRALGVLQGRLAGATLASKGV